MRRSYYVLISGLLSATSCGARSAVEPAAQPPADAANTTVSTAAATPITLSWLAQHSYSLNVQIQAAADAPTRACMEAAGFTYSATTPASSIGGVVDPARIFGITDPAEAARVGYGGNAEGDPDLSGPALETMGAPTDAEGRQRWNVALLGANADLEVTDPFTGAVLGSVRAPDGCRGEGLIAVLGTRDAVVTYFTTMVVLEQVVRDAHLRTEQSPAFASLAAEWSACMAANGYEAIDPYEFGARNWPAPRPSTSELQAAAQDVACKAEVSLVDRGLAIEEGFYATLADGYSAELATLSALTAAFR